MPATISVTRSAAAAMRWFTAPSRSRKRSPIAVGGWTPSPTSLETTTSETRRSPRTRGELVGRRQDGRVVVAPVQEVGDPEREAVDDDQVEPRRQATAGAGEVERLLDGEPVARAAPRGAGRCGAACRRRAVWAVATKRGATADAERPRATAYRLLPLRAPPRMRCDWCSDDPQVLPRRPVWRAGVRAGLLAFGSPYSPRLPGPIARQWLPWVSSPITVTGSRRIRTAFPGARAPGGPPGHLERKRH